MIQISLKKIRGTLKFKIVYRKQSPLGTYKCEWFYKHLDIKELEGIIRQSNKDMSEIWKLFDSFCCPFCYKEYSEDFIPVIICRNSHESCRYCLWNFYEAFQIEKHPVFLCPICKVIIQEEFIKEDMKLLRIKEAAKKAIERERCSERPEHDQSYDREKAAEEFIRKKEMEELQSRNEELANENETLWKALSQHQSKIKTLEQENTTLGDLNRQIIAEIDHNKFLQEKIEHLQCINLTLEQQVSNLKRKSRGRSPNRSREHSPIDRIRFMQQEKPQEKPSSSSSEAIIPQENKEMARQVIQAVEEYVFPKKAIFQKYKVSGNDLPVQDSSDKIESQPVNAPVESNSIEEEEFVYQSPEIKKEEDPKIV